MAWRPANIPKAREIIDELKSASLISERSYQLNIALTLFTEGKFADAVSIYEELGETTHSLCIESYAKLGRIDKLRESYEEHMEQYSWRVRQTVSLAYLIRASRYFKEGDSVRAINLIKPAQRSGIGLKYLALNCGSHCRDINLMFLEIFQRSPQRKMRDLNTRNHIKGPA